MSVREDREVAEPPAKVLAAMATAGENQGYKVLDVRPKERLLLMGSSVTLKGFSFGFIVNVRVVPRRRGSRLSIDVTPRLGSWALESSNEELHSLVREFQAVLAAPKARIRSPKKVRPGVSPFGFYPEIFAVLWGLSSLVVYGFLVGGFGWIPAVFGVAGAFMIASPRLEPWWEWGVTAAGVASLPFGLLGLMARRMATASAYWKSLIEP